MCQDLTFSLALYHVCQCHKAKTTLCFPDGLKSGYVSCIREKPWIYHTKTASIVKEKSASNQLQIAKAAAMLLTHWALNVVKSAKCSINQLEAQQHLQGIVLNRIRPHAVAVYPMSLLWHWTVWVLLSRTNVMWSNARNALSQVQ